MADKLERAVGGCVRGQLLVALTIAVLYGIGLSLIGVPLAIGLAFMTGLFYPIPVVGITVALTPTLLLALSKGVSRLIGALLLFITINRLENLFSSLPKAADPCVGLYVLLSTSRASCSPRPLMAPARRHGAAYFGDKGVTALAVLD